MKAISIRTLIVFVIIFYSGISNAKIYYVDSRNGNDGNVGNSEVQAWKTILKINSITLKPGDYVLFKCGGLWREQLNINSSGSSKSVVNIASYGNGDKPIISGADLITNFAPYAGSVWQKTINTLPRQVFFNNTRGIKKNTLNELKNKNEWFFTSGVLYIIPLDNPSNSGISIEAAVRPNAINIGGKNLVVKDLQVEKTLNDAIIISKTSANVVLDNLNFIQWTNEVNMAHAGAAILGNNCTLKNSNFGKNTGNDIADQNWAGFMAVLSLGANIEIANNKVYHNSVENEDGNGKYAHGIRINGAAGTVKVHGNTIYHIAGNAIMIDALTKKGDEIQIYENNISYPGQAGIAAYKTRGSDGIGGRGYVYRNNVSYANRLGGDVGGGGTRASGIHFNDGIQSGVSSSQPYIKWYCYENTVHDSQSPKERKSPDSDGIALDYNANGVEVFKNKVYNCDGKGIYIWNADDCKIFYNVVSGNDCGITVTATDKGGETANNNKIYNNVFYKNYNGDDRGKNYNCEIYFGLNGKNNEFKNNILYASSKGYSYYFNPTNSSGCVADYNDVYSDKGVDAAMAFDGSKGGAQPFAKWRANHPDWDKNSISADPALNDPDKGDFSIKSNSPCVSKGTPLGPSFSQFIGNTVPGKSDIGVTQQTLHLKTQF